MNNVFRRVDTVYDRNPYIFKLVYSHYRHPGVGGGTHRRRATVKRW